MLGVAKRNIRQSGLRFSAWLEQSPKAKLFFSDGLNKVNRCGRKMANT